MLGKTNHKTGHAYLSAELGVGGFRPTVVDYILRRNDSIMEWIGGTELEETPTNDPYVINWHPQTIGDSTYAIVSVRLFAKQMGPTFLVIGGEI